MPECAESIKAGEPVFLDDDGKWRSVRRFNAIEALAIRAAKGNNGGEWATHYTEDQKDYWRQFVRDLAAAARNITE